MKDEKFNGMQALWNDRILNIIGVDQSMDALEFRGGRCQFFRTPDVAEFAYKHTLFAPLEQDVLEAISQDRRALIPQDVWALYAVVNGFHMYNASLHFYGISNPKYTHQPFTLDSPNGHDAPRGLRDDQFAFMTVHTSSNSSGTFYTQSGERRVYLCFDGHSTEPIASWENLEQALLSVITHAEVYLSPLAQDRGVDYSAFIRALSS
ncbi:hypothetical protein LAJ19_20415 (plasmid) [Deinococcus taeanensis]|uniref:hypothetical protein n=1 Tax=Deinococcus taeanensis TaxID=2737050 RepID=UPI001CDBAECC|nr:hypothetical protein [Deinococcus taeanensis]UBV45178.1 hypothetical protein LAJ19_20415 [Deinococcus taeanensis]